MDLYIFIALLKVTVKAHIMIADKRFGNHFSLHALKRCLINDVVHISYYYDVGRFKLLTLPSILGTLKHLRWKKNALRRGKPVQGLGALFS